MHTLNWSNRKALYIQKANAKQRAWVGQLQLLLLRFFFAQDIGSLRNGFPYVRCRNGAYGLY